MHLLKRRLFWVYLLALITIFYGVVYVSVQQALRMGANEPQASMIKDIATQLNNGRQPSDFFNKKIDIGSNMAPFVIIYDKYGKVVSGDGYIGGSAPQVPIGVLAATKGHKTNTVTWQPNDKIRIASVSTEANNYYVLGGRSLLVVESKIKTFTKCLVIAFLATVAATVAAYKLINKKPRKAPAEQKHPAID
jgi:hypothetical protein